MKRALIIGGTGTISLSLVKLLAGKQEWEVYTLNRGNRCSPVPAEVHTIIADIHNETDVRSKLQNMHF